MRGARPTALQKRYVATAGRALVLLFPRDEWSLEEAKIWAHLNKWKVGKVEVKQNYIRIIQPGGSKKPERSRVVRLGPGGIKAAVGWR